MLVSLTVGDVMTATVETISPEATAQDAAEAFDAADVGSLVVVDGDVPVGIVTDTDLVRLVARGGDPEAALVRSFMTSDPAAIDPGATLEEAAELLADGQFRRLPVTDAGELLGVLSVTDLSYYLPRLSPGDLRGRKEPSRAPEIAYEDADWEFELSGETPGTLEVGDGVSFEKTLSADDVEAFAEASGDTNRVHLDAAFAERTRFGRRVVHGVLTAGVISAALARLPGLTILLSQDVRYLDPVDIGETVTAVCEVVEDLGGGRFCLSTAVVGADGTRVVDGETVVLVEQVD